MQGLNANEQLASTIKNFFNAISHNLQAIV